MKIPKIISVKSVLRVTVISILFTMTSCNGGNRNPKNEIDKSSALKTDVRPPEMEIHTAALLGNLKAIRDHIEAGTDLDEKDAYGSTPLLIAATFGKTEVAKALIEAGADVNITSNDGATALHTAAFLCRTEIVRALLNNGADKHIKNNFGSTALESVSGPFEDVRFIYDKFSKDLGPLGLKLNYEHIKVSRPVIAEILQ